MVGVGLKIVEVVPQIQFFQELKIHQLIHLSFGKAGPFTLENHIHVKALNMQGFSHN